MDPPPTLADGYRVRGARWGTFVVKDGRDRARQLEIGHRNDEAAEVLSGLREGVPVIVHPTDAVADGVRVAQQ
jgi:HlyD family secretion protein